MIETDKMPMGGKLTAAGSSSSKLTSSWADSRKRRWTPRSRRGKRAVITPQARNWWQFRKPVKAPGPQLRMAVKNKDQVKTPIDAFTMGGLNVAGSLAAKWSRGQVAATHTHLLDGVNFQMVARMPS
jgi:hypothetical protein